MSYKPNSQTANTLQACDLGKELSVTAGNCPFPGGVLMVSSSPALTTNNSPVIECVCLFVF